MAQGGSLVGLVEDQDSLPAPDAQQLTTACNSSLRGSNTHMVYRHTCRQNTHSDKINKEGKPRKQNKQIKKIARRDHPSPQNLSVALQYAQARTQTPYLAFKGSENPLPACLSLQAPSFTMLCHCRLVVYHPVGMRAIPVFSTIPRLLQGQAGRMPPPLQSPP